MKTRVVLVSALLVLCSLGCGGADVGCGGADGGCGGADGSNPASVAIRGTLTPAPGIAVGDYTVWGAQDGSPSGVASNGAWSAQSYVRRTGIIFATPKAGSGTALLLGPESGLYMTPVADTARLVKGAASTDGATDASAADGAVAPLVFDGGLAVDGGTSESAGRSLYGVVTEGEATMDATTTVIAMLLMHPALAHPSSNVSVQQLRWMATRLASGWACLSNAAVAYDADLVAKVDFSADPAFMTPFATCLDDIAAVPAFTETVPVGKLKTGQPVNVEVQTVGIAVSTLKTVDVNSEAVIMAPGTKDGAGLDYYYTVKQVDDALTRSGAKSPIFASPNQLQVHATVSNLAAGFIPSSSYWSYLDVVGNAFKKVTSLVTSAVAEAPNRRVTMPSQHMYEVRFFSGGFGIGSTADAYAFATANFSAEHEAALYQNVTMAVVETISLIPGAGEVLAEGDGGKILQAVVTKNVTDLRALLAAKGVGHVTGDDIYNLAYGTCKTAIDSTVSVVTSDVQVSLGQKLLGWVIGGGKKTIKAVLGLPGKVAKGGSLGNRAFRLSNPDSVMEYDIVAVGDDSSGVDGGLPGHCTCNVLPVAQGVGTTCTDSSGTITAKLHCEGDIMKQPKVQCVGGGGAGIGAGSCGHVDDPDYDCAADPKGVCGTNCTCGYPYANDQTVIGCVKKK